MGIDPGLREKLQQIKALVDRAGTPGEKEAAAGRLAALMAKHNIVMAEIGDIRQSSVEQALLDTGSKANWQRKLTEVVSRYHFCEGFYYHNDTRVLIVGRPENIAVVQEILPWLRGVIYKTSRDEHEKAKKGDREEDWMLPYEQNNLARMAPKRWLDSFRHGMVAGIGKKMQEARDEARKEVGEARWGLVPLLEGEVKRYVTENINARRDRSKKNIDRSVYDAGYRAGYAMNLTAQVGSSDRNALGG